LISKKLSLAVGIPYNARKLYKVCTYISTVYVGGPMLQNKSVNLCIGLTLILESAYARLYTGSTASTHQVFTNKEIT